MIPNENPTTSPSTWEQQTLEKLLFASIKEQRRKRRWGIFFKCLFFIFLFLLVCLMWSSSSTPVTTGIDKPHIALINIRGEIDETNAASADNIIEGLHDALKNKNTKAVILHINSPGGSPVQAADVFDEIRYQEQKHPNVKIYAVCADLCTSAAYYIAAASDDIYANPASLVGSVGVMLDGFGFVDTLQKLGVQRRLLTSGTHKDFLDPFSPLKPQDQQFAQQLLDNVHQQFIQSVKEGRGARLKPNPDIFSGLAWTGSQALPLGLIDGFGSTRSIARNVIKNDNLVDFTVKPGFFQQLSDRVSASFSQQLVGLLNIGSGLR